MPGSSGRWKALGPGLLFAAVSVGVSHLVQSTRAGAGFGLSLVWVIVVALILKWPLFEFGQRYAAATGTSLLEGYRRQGKWCLVLYLVATIGAMFTVLAAVGAVTAGLAIQLTGLSFGGGLPGVQIWTAILLAGGGALLLVGRYPLLDKAIKIVMAVLGVSAIAATVMVLPRLSGISLWGEVHWSDLAVVGFVVGLVGWMPTGMDVSVWQSFWTLARRRETGHAPTLKETLFDFRFGYVGTGLLAIMFCVLGTAVMFGPGIAPAKGASGFAAQIVDLFTSSLGEWSRPIILVAAFTTMFSTTLTVMDGFPRGLQLAVRRFRSEETEAEVSASSARAAGYVIWMAVLGVGAMAIVLWFMKSLLDLVNIATILSFITGPFLGILTYRAITAAWVPDEYKPGPALRALALAGIVFLTAFLALFGDLQLRSEKSVWVDGPDGLRIGLTVDPADSESGEKIVVTLRIENHGSKPVPLGPLRAELLLGDLDGVPGKDVPIRHEDRPRRELAPGDAEHWEWELGDLSPGHYSLMVVLRDDSREDPLESGLLVLTVQEE